MKKTKTRKMLSNKELAMFCDQIAMILNAGISPMEGISIMMEDSATAEGKEILSIISDQCNIGETFHHSVEASGVFPKYALDMIEIGEHSGKLEDVMRSLASHYKREENIAEGIKNAITYPFVIVGMMLIVILVLVVKVLPIFNEVFIQLGSEMTGFSRSLLNFGSTITNYSLIFVAVFIILFAAYLFYTHTMVGKKQLAGFCSKFFVTKPFYDKIASSRFASGMSITMSAGLDTDQSLEMVERLVDNPAMEAKVSQCRALMEDGSSFSEALVETNIFTSMYSRMISIGYKTGSVDKVLEKIALGYEDEIDTKINQIITVLEPTLVIILSIIVCMILLSVMMPLMGIMSSIG